MFFLRLFALLAILFPSSALSLSGNELLEDCQSDLDFSYGTCLGFIYGSSRTLISFSDGVVCVPSGVNVEQKVDVVVQYLKQNPTIRHQAAELLIAKSLRRAWPCK